MAELDAAETRKSIVRLCGYDAAMEAPKEQRSLAGFEIRRSAQATPQCQYLSVSRQKRTFCGSRCVFCQTHRNWPASSMSMAMSRSVEAGRGRGEDGSKERRRIEPRSAGAVMRANSPPTACEANNIH